MKKSTFILIYLIVISNAFSQSKLIELNASGNLVYNPDPDGFILPDFSHAGYRGGGINIPEVSVVKEISPIEGDNTSHIQTAIDEVGKMPLDKNGIRGALLLKAGAYQIEGSINLKYSGIILRGEGNNSTSSKSTIIYAKGNTPHQRDVIVLGNSVQNKWTSKINGTETNITDNIVSVGSNSFSVSDASKYNKGDLIAIYQPCTEEWIKAVNYGGVPAPNNGENDNRWQAGKLPIIYHRYITGVNKNIITIDAPIFYTLNRNLSQSYIYKFKSESILKEIGIENLCIEIESNGGQDENHAWQGIRFRSTENCWARNVTVSGFGQSGFITDCSTRITIENCQAVDPVSLMAGERRYNFNTYVNSQLILFKNCYARGGRHHYVSNGTSSTSGNVFLFCTSDDANSVSEGHRQWTQGMLFDNHKEINPKRSFLLGLYNRVNMGSGHGWAAVQSVLWNCDVTSSGVIGLQKPPTSQNYAIGCTAKNITGSPIKDSNFQLGYVESQNNPIQAIPSLYEKQLEVRLKTITSINYNVKEKIRPYSITKNGNNILISFIDEIPTSCTINSYNTRGLTIKHIEYENNLEQIEIPITDNITIIELIIGTETYIEKLYTVAS